MKHGRRAPCVPSDDTNPNSPCAPCVKAGKQCEGRTFPQSQQGKHQRLKLLKTHARQEDRATLDQATEQLHAREPVQTAPEVPRLKPRVSQTPHLPASARNDSRLNGMVNPSSDWKQRAVDAFHEGFPELEYQIIDIQINKIIRFLHILGNRIPTPNCSLPTEASEEPPSIFTALASADAHHLGAEFSEIYWAVEPLECFCNIYNVSEGGSEE